MIDLKNIDDLARKLGVDRIDLSSLDSETSPWEPFAFIGGNPFGREPSVQVIEGRDAVFVRTTTGFRVQPVSVSQRSGGRAVILQGLKGGETLAVKNAFLLKAELGKSAEED